MNRAILLTAILLTGCGDSPLEPTPTKPDPLIVTGTVTLFEFEELTTFENLSQVTYDIIVRASRSTSDCILDVQWLDDVGDVVATHRTGADLLAMGPNELQKKYLIDTDEALRVMATKVRTIRCNPF